MPRTQRKLKVRTVHRPRKPIRKPETAIIPVKPQEMDYLRQESLRAPSIQETVHKHKEIRVFIRRMLRSGTDYDQIPGTNGKALLQPGAEKIALWLKVRPYFEKVESDLGNGHIEIVSRCHLVPFLVYDLIMGMLSSGTPNIKEAVEAIIRASELSNAEASCSTMETNFRYRWADMRDEEGNPIKVDKAKAARLAAINMGRWIPGKMRNGKIVAMTPADKKKGTPAEYWIWQERVENPNIYDERNKVRQMGEKRAFVKSIRRMGALSEVFQEDPSEWPETLDVRTEKEPEEAFKPGQVVQDEEPVKPLQDQSKPGFLVISWKDNDVAIASEDAKDLHKQIVGQFQGIKLQGKDEYIVSAAHVPELIEYAQSLGWQVQEQPLLKPKKHRDISDAANEEKGVIENCKEAQGAKSKYWTVKFNGAWLYCYSATLGKIFLGAIGKKSRLLVKRTEGKPPVIEGALQIGTQEYDSDGKTEIVDRNTHARVFV